MADMGVPKGQDAFVGLFADPRGQLSWRSDPVWFADKLAKTMASVQGSVWTMPVDVESAGEINPTRPRANTLTPRRVECFTKLIADTLATRDMIRPHTYIEVPLVEGGFCQVPFEEVTVTEWCRILVAEVAPSGQAQKRAEVALEEMTLIQGESWMAAARRLVLHMRAVTADETKPHASEEQYFWRYVAGKHVSELCERAVNLFFTSESDRNGLEALLVQIGTEIKQQLTPMHVHAGKLLSAYMVARGRVAHGIFDRLVKALLTRCNRYPIASAPGGRKRDSVAALSQSHRLPMTRGTRSELPKREERRGGDRLPARESTRVWRKNLEAIRDSACAALGAAGYGLDDEDEEEEEDKTTDRPQPLAAFSNIRASTPGAHGTPFVSRRGGRNDRWRKRDREENDTSEEDDELPSQEAEDSVIINALRRRKICFFHARGSPCPHENKNSSRKGCRFSHDEAVVPYGHYPRRYAAGHEPTTEVETRMLTALEMLSAYTTADGEGDAGVNSS